MLLSSKSRVFIYSLLYNMANVQANLLCYLFLNATKWFITLDNQFYNHDDKKSSLQSCSTGRIFRVAARRLLLHEKTQVDWYLIPSCL